MNEVTVKNDILLNEIEKMIMEDITKEGGEYFKLHEKEILDQWKENSTEEEYKEIIMYLRVNRFF